LTTILDDASPYFLLENCRYNNEKYKKNCARLGIARDFNIVNSYTIESSCFGFEIKNPENKLLPEEEREPVIIVQFKEDHFIEFGEQLAYGIAKHLSVTITEEDKAGMVYGFDIEVDDFLHPEYEEPKHLKHITKDKRKEDKKKSKN
jgi:hypothetical protein